MVVCIKCGGKNSDDAEACRDCTWPFTLRAWASTARKIRRVTIDTCCINAKQARADLNTLERWASEGRIILERSAAMLKELKGDMRVKKAHSLPGHPHLFRFGNAFGDGVLAGPDIPAELQRILFPDTKTLTDNQKLDVEHLRLHVQTGGDVFVTLNPNDFIARGRQATLVSFGIWVTTPNELVSLLGQLYAWS